MSTRPLSSSRVPSRGRIRRGFVSGACALAILAGSASAGELSLRPPDTVYAQAGVGDDVASATIGITWDKIWSHENGWGLWEAYLDLSLGRWRLSNAGATAGHSQATLVGFMPAIRLRPPGWNDFFVEAGIGVNWIFPLYQNDTRRFSTTFNFGDHIAVGRKFGEAGNQEIALRLQHFSNAGIKHPNPGENFVQLRYSRRF